MENRKLSSADVDGHCNRMKNRSSLPLTILDKRHHHPGPCGSRPVSDTKKTAHGTNSRWSATVKILPLRKFDAVLPLDSNVSKLSRSPGALPDRHLKLELNLYCTETLSASRAADDRKRVDGNDFRVLNELLSAEPVYQLENNPYDGRFQPEINVSMRDQLAHWIYEVRRTVL